MITMEKLRAWGASTDEGLVRCLNNEAFYLRLAGMALKDPHFEMLAEACRSKDLEKAFDSAHSLKGMLSNVALTPLVTPIVQITEFLRNKTDMDYEPLVREIETKRTELLQM